MAGMPERRVRAMPDLEAACDYKEPTCLGPCIGFFFVQLGRPACGKGITGGGCVGAAGKKQKRGSESEQAERFHDGQRSYGRAPWPHGLKIAADSP